MPTFDPEELEKAYAAASAGSDEPDYMEVTLGFLRRTVDSERYETLRPWVRPFVEGNAYRSDDTWVALTKTSIRIID